MAPEDALRAFAKALAVGDVAGAAALFTEDATYDEPPVHFAGRAAIAGFIEDFAARHHTAAFTVSRSLVSLDGELAAAEWRWSYTRNVDGEDRAFEGVCFVAFRDGLIAAWRGFSARMR